jgi:hypothetical protein
VVGKGHGKMNIVQIYMYVNGNMRPVETIPEIGEEEKGEWWRGEFKYDIL